MATRSTMLRPLLRAKKLPSGFVAHNIRIIRSNSSYQPPTPPAESGNAHRNFYKAFGRPMVKVFLGALCTYQILYWSWLKLESVEYKEKTEDEINALEAQLSSLRKDKTGEK